LEKGSNHEGRGGKLSTTKDTKVHEVFFLFYRMSICLQTEWCERA